MREKFRPQVVFHAGAHPVPVIGRPEVAQVFQCDQREAQDPEAQDLPAGFTDFVIDHVIGDVANDQRDHKHDRRTQYRKEHIPKECPDIGFVIGKEFRPFVIFHEINYTIEADQNP